MAAKQELYQWKSETKVNIIIIYTDIGVDFVFGFILTQWHAGSCALDPKGKVLIVLC